MVCRRIYLLHSGRSLPVGDDNATRREGVGIALDEKAHAAAWRAAGEIWEEVSSRIVTARLKLAHLGQRMIGGSRERDLTPLLL